MARAKKLVVVDARMIGPIGHGIAQYVQQLAQGLAERNPPFGLRFLTSPALPRNSPLRAFSLQEVEIPFLHPLEPFRLGREIRRAGADLYHSPSFSSLASYPCPYVQTVHDLNHWRFGHLAQKFYYRLWLLRSMRGAKALVTVSESARKEIAAWLARYGIERKIEIAYNAIELAPESAESGTVLENYGLQAGEYFFTLANSKPHKNLPLLEAAYREARQRSAALPILALTNSGPEEAGIRHLGPLAASEIFPLLAQARAFFYPSLYEGFGRPPVEAALAGTQPVVSDIPVHREALAGVREAEFLPPQSLLAWAEAFARKAAGAERVSGASQDWIRRRYSVAQLAEAMERIYGEAL